MNSDQIKGSIKDVAGKAQRKLGEAIGSTEQQVKGAATQVEGKAQKAVGDVREAVRDTRDNRKI
ncbi:CsbD family protein [Roseateles sp. NT4]|uniref:CsbD family protein n=1 Tax=Roseateles sp. NT4 TaxID=3453715 RepID=UPI003EEC360F